MWTVVRRCPRPHALLSNDRVVNRARPAGGRRSGLGADDVLSLPFDSAELLSRIRSQLRSKQARRGDVLPDKIVYDAQTTSGGSGGPLFNDQGQVIGINFAILRDFGGSNFAIPVRFGSRY